MKNYYITWQPEVAETGHYFLTLVQSDNADLKSLMTLAHESEEIEVGQYDLCSIICAENASVIY